MRLLLRERLLREQAATRRDSSVYVDDANVPQVGDAAERVVDQVLANDQRLLLRDLLLLLHLLLHYLFPVDLSRE